MYASIDALSDKLDRQVLKHKEKVSAHRADREVIDHTLATGAPPGQPAE
jgi:putative sigma-54 modulation protein